MRCVSLYKLWGRGARGCIAGEHQPNKSARTGAALPDGCRLYSLRRSAIGSMARFLDQLRYDDWLSMYAAECVYWVPSTPKAGDPRREIAIMFDDRRRLEDRIYRMRTGFAWSQAPASRTVRLVTNVEVFSTIRDDARMVRSNFMISEFWGDETRQLTGWAAHRLVRDYAGWKIQTKQVNLIECDQSIRNPSIIL